MAIKNVVYQFTNYSEIHKMKNCEIIPHKGDILVKDGIKYETRLRVFDTGKCSTLTIMLKQIE